MDYERINYHAFSIGCDPEFFVKNKRKIIESSKLIPEDGIKFSCFAKKANSTTVNIVCDGVQIEINPAPSSCRAYVGNAIAEAFKKLKDSIDNDNKITLTPVVKLSKKAMKELSDKAKTFGCAPSFNNYTSSVSVIPVDASKYQYRSAGGHLHIGDVTVKKYLQKEVDLTIKFLDLICGNTCVLIDTDPAQKERRKVYGKAGEYRLPSYGIEYRTLSNFWLKDYKLMSLVMALARFACDIVINIHMQETNSIDNTPNGKRSKLRDILDLVDMKDVELAINNNDQELAYKNFNAVKEKLASIVPETGRYLDHFPFNNITLPAFEYFIARGIEYWFKGDPIDNWINMPEGHNHGWESFLLKDVMDDMASNGIVN